MALFNVISDPALKARQDELDAQWSSLSALYSGCDQTPDNAFAEFSTDLRLWREFYASGSDWSASSKTATDTWQTKAQDWSRRLQGWGCYGTAGSDQLDAGSGAIPTVKDPPPDAPGLLDNLKALDPLPEIEKWAEGVGLIVVGVVVLVIIAIVYITTKGHAKGYGVEVGGT